MSNHESLNLALRGLPEAEFRSRSDLEKSKHVWSSIFSRSFVSHLYLIIVNNICILITYVYYIYTHFGVSRCIKNVLRNKQSCYNNSVPWKIWQSEHYQCMCLCSFIHSTIIFPPHILEILTARTNRWVMGWSFSLSIRSIVVALPEGHTVWSSFSPWHPRNSIIL